jgi:hypothetical protein
MANVWFDNPPRLNGEEREQLNQLYWYLNAMSEKLNQALMNISSEQMNEDTAAQIRTAGGEKATQEVNTLKSMIIKTAEVVRSEMTEISTHLQAEYTALSQQFGTYQETIESDIRATAEGVLQEYHYSERIDALESGETEGATFRNDFRTYIFMGILDATTGETGIAIGDGVTRTDEHGNMVLNDERKTATFSQTELAFWHGENKIAWFSDNVFHIRRGEITDSLQIGNHTWMAFQSGAMALVKG